MPDFSKFAIFRKLQARDSSFKLLPVCEETDVITLALAECAS